jgi:hypothetical protein
VLVLVGFQHVTLCIDITFFCRPQRQGADGVGEARPFDGFAFLLKLCRGRVVSSEKNLERCAILDLGVELAGCAVSGKMLGMRRGRQGRGVWQQVSCKGSVIGGKCFALDNADTRARSLYTEIYSDTPPGGEGINPLAT